MKKRYLGQNVLDAARSRIKWVFDTFPKIYISFSGGKDSTNKARSPPPLGGGGIAFDTFICSYDNHIVCNR